MSKACDGGCGRLGWRMTAAAGLAVRSAREDLKQVERWRESDTGMGTLHLLAAKEKMERAGLFVLMWLASGRDAV